MRDIIVVDVETGGLVDDVPILEVAAVNMTTGQELVFAPFVAHDSLLRCEPVALQINRYYERGVFKWADSEGKYTQRNYQDLSKMLEGNTFAGSNPTFDSQRLKWHTNVVWHHRLLDLAAYSAGVLRLPPNHLQGLEWVCKELGVENTEPHSALGDARATAECFRKLMEMAK